MLLRQVNAGFGRGFLSESGMLIGAALMNTMMKNSSRWICLAMLWSLGLPLQAAPPASIRLAMIEGVPALPGPLLKLSVTRIATWVWILNWWRCQWREP